MRCPEDFINKIICGDCLEVMKTMPDNSIDTIITDPPYNLTSTTRPRPDQSENGSYGRKVPFSRQQSRGGFMGKNWDGTGISFDIKLWKEALRIAKPGTTLLCFGGTRTYHRLACAIEDAGWILKDCIMWLYGSGFPKATDISQMLDKDECRKQLEKKLGRKSTQEEFKKEWEGFRNIVGHKSIAYPDSDCWGTPNKSGIENDKSIFNIGKVDKGGTRPIIKPATPEAKLWNGWKSHGLKPAYEPILVAMKPNEGSYANNALKWSVAGLNIDGGRIGFEEGGTVATNPLLRKQKGRPHRGADWYPNGKGQRDDIDRTQFTNYKGRFPANIIHDGSDEVVRLFPNTGTSYRPNSRRGKIKSEIYMNGIVRDGYPTAIGVNDSGSASRFFYCAKASKAERNRGCEGLEKKERANINKMMGKAGNFKTGSGNLRTVKFKNNHPTVKPLALMKYLCTLTKTPTGGIVLDPFCGSGTTLMACKETGRKYIGIEIEKEYIEIAQCRIGAVETVLF